MKVLSDCLIWIYYLFFADLKQHFHRINYYGILSELFIEINKSAKDLSFANLDISVKFPGQTLSIYVYLLDVNLYFPEFLQVLMGFVV